MPRIPRTLPWGSWPVVVSPCHVPVAHSKVSPKYSLQRNDLSNGLRLTSPNSSNRHISLAQGTDHQENAHISGSIIHGHGSARNSNIPLGATRNIQVIITSAIVANIADRLWQDREQFFVKVASVLFIFLAVRYANGLVFLSFAHLVGSVGPVNRNHVVVLS